MCFSPHATEHDFPCYFALRRGRMALAERVWSSMKRSSSAGRPASLRGVLALGVGALLLALAGCTPLDRLSVRYVDGVLQFASCHTVDANLVEVAVRSASDPTAIEPVWLLEGDVRVRPGDVFTMGERISGLATVVDGVVPSRAGEVYFSVGARDDSGEFGDVRSARFFVGDIREGEWTRSNGSRGEQPCE